MPAQDTIREDESTNAEREQSEQERVARSAALAANETVEDEAWAALHEAAEGSVREREKKSEIEAQRPSPEDIHRIALSAACNSCDRNSNDGWPRKSDGNIDWTDVNEEMKTIKNRLESDSRTKGFTEADIASCIEQVEQALENMKKREGLKNSLLETMLRFSKMDSMDWKGLLNLPTLDDFRNISLGGDERGIFKIYEEKFGALTLDDYGYALSVCRQKILEMMIDANGKSLKEYKQEHGAEPPKTNK